MQERRSSSLLWNGKQGGNNFDSDVVDTVALAKERSKEHKAENKDENKNENKAKNKEVNNKEEDN